MRSGSKTQGPFQIRTPAKVTLHLEVLGLRGDGYHEVEVVFAPVSIFDRIEAAPLGAGKGLMLDMKFNGEPVAEPISMKENLAFRAALAFNQALASHPVAVSPTPFSLKLVKEIPSGAGLGGGSGNAGGVLVALNRWHGAPLAPETLERLALGLGADVPFFLDPRPALARGIGERLTPLEGWPRLELLVVKPGFSIPTGEAYGAVDRLPAIPPRRWEGSPRSPGEVSGRLYNRFEAALFPTHPELEEIRALLLAGGALGAGLSGSGSAVFGIFPGAPSRELALENMEADARRRGWRLYPCHTLGRHRYDLIH